jgi:hypothetical protein
MLIPLFGICTIWKWAVLPTCQRNILSLSSELKWAHLTTSKQQHLSTKSDNMRVLHNRLHHYVTLMQTAVWNSMGLISFVSSSLTPFFPSLYYFRNFILFRSIFKSCLMVEALIKYSVSLKGLYRLCWWVLYSKTRQSSCEHGSAPHAHLTWILWVSTCGHT